MSTIELGSDPDPGPWAFHYKWLSSLFETAGWGFKITPSIQVRTLIVQESIGHHLFGLSHKVVRSDR